MFDSVGWSIFTVVGRKLLILVSNVDSCSKNKSITLSVNFAHKRHCFDIFNCEMPPNERNAAYEYRISTMKTDKTNINNPIRMST